MRICILGVTGLVGMETLDLVARAWPKAEVVGLASRARTLESDGRRLEVRAATDLDGNDAPRGDLALVALDDEHSRRYVPRLLELGYRVVDKSNTYRLDPKVPLVVAGVNTHVVDDAARLVANPNCTTIPLALAVAPLHREWGLRSLAVSTYQAVSGAGIGPLDDFLAASKDGYARMAESGDRFGAPFAPSAYAGNVVPHAGGTDDSGFSSEERKLMVESRKILELPELPVVAQCCRVAVAVGHYENAWVELDAKVTAADVERVLAGASPWLRFHAGAAGEGLSARAAIDHRDHALVGRVRMDPRDREGRTVCITVVADNLRFGAATNAVRVASRWFTSADPALQA
jgi:aspartate-semialdehyde dehydrogenase